MKRCMECGSVTDDDSYFCSRCGCNRLEHVSSSSDCSTYRPKPSGSSPSLTKFIALVAVVAIIATVFYSIYGVDDRESYENETISCAWSVPTINDKIGAKVAFEVTFTIYGSELSEARSSDINRSGSSTDIADHANNQYAIGDYVVSGKTVKELSQKLWNEFHLKINDASYHSCNNARYFADYVLAFVQAAAVYENDGKQFSNDEYWLYPVETLHFKKGDCEDTAILGSAIFNTLSTIDGAKEFVKGGCVYLMPSHAMLGACLHSNITPSAGEVFMYALVDDDRYYFGETTISNPGSYSPEGWAYVGYLNPDYDGTHVQGFTGTSYVYA